MKSIFFSSPARFSTFLFFAFCCLFWGIMLPANGQSVTKSDPVSLTVDGTVIPRTLNFSTGDFGGPATVTSVTVTVDFRPVDGSCPGPGAFGFSEEAGFWLDSPSGTRRRLVIDAYNIHGLGFIPATYNGFGSVRAVVTFDDAAATLVGGGDPQTGTFRPYQSISTPTPFGFAGETAIGNWTLRIVDGNTNFPTCFFGWSMTLNSGVVPVDLVSFDAVQDGKNAKLTWTTERELNTDHFVLKRSFDGVEFEEIAGVDGAGNSEELQEYTLVDQEVGFLSGDAVYYRLEQVDQNGTRSSLGMKTLVFQETDAREPLIFPNPASDHFSIVLPQSKKCRYTLRVMNITGAEVWQGELTENQLEISTLNWEPGVYFVRFEGSDPLPPQKVMIQ